jgi:ABC-2 type transport system permease protein
VKFVKLMIWKEFAHIRGDGLSIKLMIFPVLAQMLILGYALTTEVKNTPVTALDLSNSVSSRSLIESIKHNDLFIYKRQSVDFNEIRSRIDQGEIKIGIVIPTDFDRKIRRNEGADIQILVDGQDANSSNVATGYINAIIRKWSSDFLRQELNKQGTNPETLIPVQINPVILFNPLLKSTWYMIPALVVLLVTMVTSLLSGLSIVKEKEAGTLEQILVTPVKPFHIILGKTVPYLLIGVAELIVFLVFATLWFGIPFRGNFFTFILFGILYMISSLGIGILTSTIARSAQQVLFLIWFILIFFILLSGFFIPIENMPLWVQNITNINPVKFFMFAVRELFLKGSGLEELWKEALSMLAIGVCVFSASIVLFHRKAG